MYELRSNRSSRQMSQGISQAPLTTVLKKKLYIYLMIKLEQNLLPNIFIDSESSKYKYMKASQSVRLWNKVLPYRTQHRPLASHGKTSFSIKLFFLPKGEKCIL